MDPADLRQRSRRSSRPSTRIQLSSWRTYENYTGPLGLQTLTDIVGNHYSVNVEASERNGWGQWHRADEKGVGMDRTVATGTGYIGQYRRAVARIYESLATCPDDLLLFLHHVPYTHKLHSGKTVIQYLYDSHYEGAARVAEYVRAVEGAEGAVDDSAIARCWRNSNIRRARRRLARRGDALVREAVRHRGREGPRRQLPGPRRSGVDEARGLHRARHHAVGGGIGGKAVTCASGSARRR